MNDNRFYCRPGDEFPEPHMTDTNPQFSTGQSPQLRSNEMYENAAGQGPVGYADVQAKQLAYAEELTLTPRQNIARRIKSLKAEIERLQVTENSMEATNLLDVPIHQLRNAMQF